MVVVYFVPMAFPYVVAAVGKKPRLRLVVSAISLAGRFFKFIHMDVNLSMLISLVFVQIYNHSILVLLRHSLNAMFQVAMNCCVIRVAGMLPPLVYLWGGSIGPICRSTGNLFDNSYDFQRLSLFVKSSLMKLWGSWEMASSGITDSLFKFLESCLSQDDLDPMIPTILCCPWTMDYKPPSKQSQIAIITILSVALDLQKFSVLSSNHQCFHNG